MSLKAKLEAVIYAAEEPVTLAQLAALFAADALEWKAEREAASVKRTEAAQESLAGFAAEGALNLTPANAEFAYLEADPSPAEPEAGAVAATLPEDGPEPSSEPLPEDAAEPESAETAAGPEPAAADAEARRLARLRDREVRSILRQLLDELMETYASDERGVEIREIAGGYRMATKPEWHDAVLSFVKSLKPALRLSLPALETLAVIAYKQPVTAPEVNEIRGVDSSGVFGSLLARKLISTAGRKPVIGRPILYKTTREFLLRFGLKDVTELPSMEEFEKLAAIELDEPEPATQGDTARLPNPAAGLEFDEAASEELEGDRAPSPAETTPNAEPPAGSPAVPAETTPAEAAPAAPPFQEQAETENSPHDD